MLGRLFRQKASPPGHEPPAELIEKITAVPRETSPVNAGTLQRLTDRGQPLDAGEAKALARHVDPQIRRALAGREDVKPELLYFLAADHAPEVRREIAGNQGSPRQADLVLARDIDPEVRCELARKIARLVPELPPEAHERVGEQTLEILELLARDQLPHVRSILSEELKHATRVPHHIVKRLAMDVERIVAAPIAEYSPLLSDDDLLEIIRGGVVTDAVARRAQVSERIADAVVATSNLPAVAALLSNHSAQIREETLDAIIDQAGEAQVLHAPLVQRPDLSLRAIRRIASFVAASLVATLAERNELDADTQAELNRAVRERINAAPAAPEADDAEARARAAHRAGMIDDDWIDEAVDAGELRLLRHGLGLKAGLPAETVSRILGARSAKAVVALAWKAGLAMRTAIRLQHRVARLPAQAVINARDGTDFPLSEEEMNWQIGYFAS
jgi:uncharacterized protein (DUF2336 family)